MVGLWFSKWYRSKRAAVLAAGLSLGWGEYGYRVEAPELVLGPRCLDWAVAGQERHYGGACLDLERRDGVELGGSALQSLVPELDERPLIYASFGSYRFFTGRRLVYEQLLKYMGTRDDLQMVLQVRDEERDGLEVPANVTVLDWAPQLALLSRASLFVTHGGLSSVKKR